jgi:serine/threonine-protein kinase
VPAGDKPDDQAADKPVDDATEKPGDKAVVEKTVQKPTVDPKQPIKTPLKKKIVKVDKPLVENKKPPIEKPEPAVSGPPGFITIDSSPVYAVIYIDNKKMGETPLVNIKLAPGKHAVRAVSPSGTSRNLSIVIESGKTAPVKRIEW